MKKFKNLDEALETIAESQKFEPDDGLSKLIKETCSDDELSIDDLDLVAAAESVPDFGKFEKYLEDRKKR